MSEEKTDFVLKEGTPEKEESGAVDNGVDDKTEAADKKSPLLPEINFPTFIISLNASALVHLGAIEDPATGQRNKNLPMAKQTIDILCLLEEKTKGNLNAEEEKILKNILYDLRIIYVKEKG